MSDTDIIAKTMAFYVLKGHSIKELQSLSEDEFLFLYTTMMIYGGDKKCPIM